MSFPSVSFATREFCRERLQDATNGFGYWMPQTAAAYGVTNIVISDQSTPPSLVLGRYDYATLRKAMGDNFYTPIAVLSVAKSDNTGRQNMRVTPSTFSGQIIVSLDFYVTPAVQSNLPPDGEAVFHAVEDALVNTFNTALSYGLMPAGTTYNNEIMVDQGDMGWDGTRWIQWIPCSMFFYQVS